MTKNEQKAFILLIGLMAGYVRCIRFNNKCVANDYLEECNGVLMCMLTLNLITREENKRVYDTMLYYK